LHDCFAARKRVKRLEIKSLIPERHRAADVLFRRAGKWSATMNNQNKPQQQQNKNPGNFANDPQKAAEAGRKGGEHSQGRSENMSGNRNQNSGQGGRADQNR
jgi:general stress protein YciG